MIEKELKKENNKKGKTSLQEVILVKPDNLFSNPIILTGFLPCWHAECSEPKILFRSRSWCEPRILGSRGTSYWPPWIPSSGLDVGFHF